MMIVGHGQSVKPHLIPQQFRQHPVRSGCGFTVKAAVAGHDAAERRFRDRCLERLSVDFFHQPARRIAGRAMDTGLRVMEGKKMLGDGFGFPSVGFSLLDTRGIGRSHSCCQGGIFAVRLSLPAHPGIPGYIEHRCKYLRKPGHPLLSRDDLRDLFFQDRIKGRAPCDPGGNSSRPG